MQTMKPHNANNETRFIYSTQWTWDKRRLFYMTVRRRTKVRLCDITVQYNVGNCRSVLSQFQLEPQRH